MRYSKTPLLRALAVGSLTYGILAQDCRTNEPTLRLSSPDQLSVFKNGCSTITGNIWIGEGYSGDFKLNGVTDFIGNISMDENRSAKNLASFEMLDLKHIDVLTLHQVANVRLPNLEHGGELLFVQSGSDQEVDLGSLKDVNNLWLWGGWKSTVLTSLNTVKGEIEFCSAPACGIFERSTPPMIVDLPVLESVNQLTVEGTVTSINVPRLKVAGNRESETFQAQGLRVNVQGEPLEVDFPEVHTLGNLLEVYGNVSKISLGALGNTSTGLNFNTDIPIEIYSSLRTAKYAYLWGKIKSISLPDYVHIPSVSIPQDIQPCNETLVNLWAEIPEVPEYQSSDEKYRCRPEDLPDDYENDSREPENTTSDEDDTATLAEEDSNNNEQDITASDDDSRMHDQDTKQSNNSVSDTGDTPVSDGEDYRLLPSTSKIAMLLITIILPMIAGNLYS